MQPSSAGRLPAPDNTPPARIYVDMQRRSDTSPLEAVNVTGAADRAEQWRRFGRTVVEYVPAPAE